MNVIYEIKIDEKKFNSVKEYIESKYGPQSVRSTLRMLVSLKFNEIEENKD